MLSNRVKAIRTEKKISQHELSRRAGISREVLSKIENGEEVTLSTVSIISISDALEASIHDVFSF